MKHSDVFPQVKVINIEINQALKLKAQWRDVFFFVVFCYLSVSEDVNETHSLFLLRGRDGDGKESERGREGERTNKKRNR